MCLNVCKRACTAVMWYIYINKAATLLPLHHIAVKWSNDQDEGKVGSLWSWTVSVCWLVLTKTPGKNEWAAQEEQATI